MDERRRRRISKLVSLLLRHDPGRAGLEPDRAGWVDVDELLAGLRRLDVRVSREELRDVVREGGKPRFECREGRIRARYGHSIDVDLGYGPAEPPEVLYHGTAAAKVHTIRREGISPMSRQQVHLSSDVPTARSSERATVGRWCSRWMPRRWLRQAPRSTGCPAGPGSPTPCRPRP